MTEIRTETGARVLPRLVEQLALVLVCGVLIDCGLLVLPLLPFALAAATRLAARAAGGDDVDLVGDAWHGMRQDAVRFLAVVGAGGLAGSALALAAGALLASPDTLSRGFGIGLLAPSAFLAAFEINGWLVASLGSAGPFATLRGALAATLSRPLRGVIAGLLLVSGVVGPMAIGSGLLVQVVLVGAAFVVAIRIAMPPVRALFSAAP